MDNVPGGGDGVDITRRKPFGANPNVGERGTDTQRRILAAGLDVFAAEPSVPDELKTLQNVVLLPHIGSASVVTRNAMDQLVVDNLKNWFAGKAPLTPVTETPVKGR